ncbi:MAG TPA: STAS domain-containing protein [Actinophytocola sp.]|jgi:anti-sigma B factor antagonist|uniref:STAS domain-containing protein n=1 Tax=Actinophytocola sp. TaxID=1872138 RepID=UPI002F935A74
MTGRDRDQRPDQCVQLSVRMSTSPRGTVLGIVGDVDLVTEARFRAAFDQALANEPDVLVADLTGVTFLGSVGLRHLVTADEAAGAGVLRVVPSPVARRAIEVSGLARVLALRSTVDEAFHAGG